MTSGPETASENTRKSPIEVDHGPTHVVNLKVKDADNASHVKGVSLFFRQQGQGVWEIGVIVCPLLKDEPTVQHPFIPLMTSDRFCEAGMVHREHPAPEQSIERAHSQARRSRTGPLYGYTPAAQLGETLCPPHSSDTSPSPAAERGRVPVLSSESEASFRSPFPS
ncbi:hypothetical protein GCM10008949_44500 [Deinococcus humi]|nr:hypothetical protein GCM10008949_44500 [Deinococcus humi]